MSKHFLKYKLQSIGLSILIFTMLIFVQACKKDHDALSPTVTEDDEELSGGTTTIFDVSLNAFGNVAPNIKGDGPDKFVIGNSFFRNNWVIAPSSTAARDGLGPMLNSFSCSGCHEDDGRGRPPLLPGESLSSMLIRLSVPGSDLHGGPLGDTEYGGQLSNKSILGTKAEGDALVNYIEVLGSYQDGAAYSIRKPEYNFINLNYGPLPADILFSPRVAPQMPGLGLLEAVDEATIISFADPNDANADGISGRPNYVWDYVNNKVSIGRFGWKANQPNLRQQTAGAFIGDMGITSSLFPEENLTGKQVALYDSLPTGGTPEISDDILSKVVYYCATLAVPARRNWTNSTVLRGKQIFTDIKCSSCHTPLMTTGNYSAIPELSNQKIRPYTDLLLHDMGPGLADGRSDYLANGQEWRTPPLWATGLIKTVSNHTFLLHDGRARNFEEAILWHGGEAQNSQNDFKKLSKTDRDALIQFLQSL